MHWFSSEAIPRNSKNTKSIFEIDPEFYNAEQVKTKIIFWLKN